MAKTFTNLNDISKAIEAKSNEISGPVSLGVLFNDKFMKMYTKFSTIDEFFDASDFVINTREDLDSIELNALDKHVANTTKFSTWDDMKAKAGEIYFEDRLKF